MAKARQKNLSKTDQQPVTFKGERFCSDISSIKTTSARGSKFWLLVVDQFTKQKWSFFLKKKSDKGQVLVQFIKELKGEGIEIKN